jgi:DNA topoisomerase-1
MHAKSVEVKEHTSLPPPRFNQASLIKALDEAGVGRPSTYKSMANMAVERGYAKLENRAYTMLPIGNTVVEGLGAYFPYVVDKEFTKEMEEHLDEIAANDENWKEWILKFKPRLDKDIEIAYKKMPDPKDELVGRNCPECGKPLIYRYSKKTGMKFIGCSSFPKCHYAEFPNAYVPKILDVMCPICGKNLVERRNRRGQPFVGCSGYPKCHYIQRMDKNNKPLPFDKEKYDKFGNYKREFKAPDKRFAKKTIKKKVLN